MIQCHPQVNWSPKAKQPHKTICDGATFSNASMGAEVASFEWSWRILFEHAGQDGIICLYKHHLDFYNWLNGQHWTPHSLFSQAAKTIQHQRTTTTQIFEASDKIKMTSLTPQIVMTVCASAHLTPSIYIYIMYLNYIFVTRTIWVPSLDDVGNDAEGPGAGAKPAGPGLFTPIAFAVSVAGFLILGTSSSSSCNLRNRRTGICLWLGRSPWELVWDCCESSDSKTESKCGAVCPFLSASFNSGAYWIMMTRMMSPQVNMHGLYKKELLMHLARPVSSLICSSLLVDLSSQAGFYEYHEPHTTAQCQMIPYTTQKTSLLSLLLKWNLLHEATHLLSSSEETCPLHLAVARIRATAPNTMVDFIYFPFLENTLREVRDSQRVGAFPPCAPHGRRHMKHTSSRTFPD